MPRIWAFLVFVAAVAGCAQPAAVVTVTTTADLAQGPAPLHGIVLDAAVRPLAGAVVSIAGESPTTTDEQGAFTFPALAPGSHLVRVNHTGYAPASVVAQVPGPRVLVHLTAVSATEPDHESFKFVGHAVLSAGVATSLLDRAAGGLATCTCSFTVTPSGPLASILLEAVWQDTIANPARPTAFTWQVTPDAGADQATGSSIAPLWREIQALDFGNQSFQFAHHASFAVHLYPDATWPAVEQEYELFVSLWYLERPPLSYSIVKGSPP